MVDFSDGALVTPERIVVLSIFCVGISGSCEDLVPECGVAVCVRDTVRRLTTGERRDQLSDLKHLLGLPPHTAPATLNRST